MNILRLIAYGISAFGVVVFCMLSLTAQAQTAGYSVSFEQSSISQDEKIVVEWTVPAGRDNALDWIGLYRTGASDRQYISWYYIPDGEREGTMVFDRSDVGEYEVRMFSDNEYVRVASGPGTLRVEISSSDDDDGTDEDSDDDENDPPSTDGSYDISLDRSVYSEGDTVTVAWTAPGDRGSRDWIGIYREDASDRAYEAWEYIPRGPQERGELTFSIDEAGAYEVRMFLNNGYTRATSKTPSFDVSSSSDPDPDDDGNGDGDDPTPGAYTVSIDPETVEPNESFTVSWTAPSDRDSSRDWVGIYRTDASDRQYVSWQYISNDTASGDLTFRVSREGTYEARVFTANGYTRVARSADQIEVGIDDSPDDGNGSGGDGDGTGAYSLTPVSTTVSSGSSVTVNWEAPTGTNLSRDWIGVYRPEASDRSYLAYQYISSNETSGSVTFTASTPGTYEFRYFKNNGYTRVATSPTLTVESAAVAACPVSDLSAIENYPPRSGPIIALGDSLTEGVGATGGQDFVSQLERKANVSIINAGVSGDTTLDALDRLESDVLSRDPSVVIVWLGGNDILQRYYEDVFSGAENPNLIEAVRIVLLRISGKLPEPSGISEDETFENLTETIERIQARGAVTIVIGFSGGVFDTDLEDRYEEVAEATNSLYVPNALNGVIGRPALMSDLVHPNNIGYGIVADRVVPILSCTL